MVQDVLERIREAEAQAERIKMEARHQADQLVSEARVAASSLIEAAKLQAREEGAKLIAAEESKAYQEAEEIRHRGILQAAQIQKETEAKLAAAVEFVLQHTVMRS